MSKHDNNDLLNPANPLSPLNPFNPLNPDHEENLEGLARAVDEMPPLFIRLIGIVWATSFIGVNIYMIGAKQIFFQESLLSAILQNSTALDMGTILFYLLTVVMFTLMIGTLTSIFVGLCYGVIAVLVFVCRSTLSFLMRIGRVLTP